LKESDPTVHEKSIDPTLAAAYARLGAQFTPDEDSTTKAALPRRGNGLSIRL
jgi:hypothetical protein